MNNFTYIIFEASEQLLLNLSELLVFSADPVRKSNDGVHAYVKYIGTMPPSVSNLTSKSPEYTSEQMESTFANEHWDTQIPF